MAQDLRTARRAEHTVARCTTYLLFACLLLEAGTLTSTFSRRAELRVAADDSPLSGVAAGTDARQAAIAKLKLAALVGTGILWLRSESMNDRDAYDDLPAPALLSGWWGMSLTWGALEEVVAATARGARTSLDLTNVTDVALVGSAVGIIAMVLAIRVVRGIDQRQQCFSANPPDLPAPSSAARHHGATAPRSIPPPNRPIVRAAPDNEERRV